MPHTVLCVDDAVRNTFIIKIAEAGDFSGVRHCSNTLFSVLTRSQEAYKVRIIIMSRRPMTLKQSAGSINHVVIDIQLLSGRIRF